VRNTRRDIDEHERQKVVTDQTDLIVSGRKMVGHSEAAASHKYSRRNVPETFPWAVGMHSPFKEERPDIGEFADRATVEVVLAFVGQRRFPRNVVSKLVQ
jgi:hypothetical protein